MTTIETSTAAIEAPGDDFGIDDARLAAVAFLARYSGRTLDAYRHDLRGFFQWAADPEVSVLAATRPHIELYRSWMENRGPASTNATIAVLLGLNGLRVSEACATNIEDLGLERGHRTLRIPGKRTKPATIPLIPPTARTIDLALANEAKARACGGRMVSGSTDERRIAGFDPSASEPASEPCTPTCSEPPSSWRPSTPECCDVQLAVRHADPRTTTIYDRRRQNFDRHAAYVVVASVAGG